MYKDFTFVQFFFIIVMRFFLITLNVDFTLGKSKLSFTKHTQIKLVVCLLNKKCSSTQNKMNFSSLHSVTSFAASYKSWCFSIYLWAPLFFYSYTLECVLHK